MSLRNNVPSVSARMDLSKLAAYFFLGALLACETRAATLGDALDNTNLVWTTGGTWNGTNYPAFAWFATNSTGPFDNSTFDGVDAAISGNRNKANSESWLRTTVVGPGTLSFWWQVNSRIGCDLEFSVSSVLQAGLAGEAINGDSVDWQYRLFTIPAGTNVLEWKYVKDGQIGNAPYDQGWLDQVIYTTNAPITLQDALNTCGLVWTSGGNANIDPTYWNGQTNVTHDGSKAAQSGAIFDSQESWMETTVSGATNVSFWWKVSSETNYDALEFEVDTTNRVSISGEVNWRSNFFTLTKTNHTLRWRYSKNDINISSRGQDRGWVDQIVLMPPLAAFPYGLTAPTRLPDGRFRLMVTGEIGCPCRVQFSTNLALTNWTTLTNFTTASASSLVTDAGASNSPQRFYRGVSP